MNFKRKAEGSSIANIILIAFAVLLAASVTATTVFLYQSNAKSTKIVNEVTSASPSADNLYKLGVLTTAYSGATVTMTRDAITEEYTMSVLDGTADATTVAAVMDVEVLKAARGVAITGAAGTGATYAGYDAAVKFKFQ